MTAGARSQGPPPSLSPGLRVLLAVAVGATAANLYYSQPLVGVIGQAIGLAPEAVGLVIHRAPRAGGDPDARRLRAGGDQGRRQRAVAKGFLLPADRDALIAQAAASNVLNP